ncbi:non-ribosomal peptide synthetase [Pectinatus brassicae]|uniref:Amino acid adenylation domain-containing protein n=1 Tax=Pectinatus brassicae TaxID=862415 RepID=A0A840UJC7_9FIRM|nr:non-ribosomal peptide synthetase [Pectinatus brassicae]MBB5336290.1 amino acid adenylation domain-containing protein [Pectinatus brassicae]
MEEKKYGKLKEIISNEDMKFYADCNTNKYTCDPNQTIVSLFRTQAAKYPQNIAVVFKNKQLTYKQLDDITDKLASYIFSLGLGKEDVVSILINRSEYMPVTGLGTAKAGAAYQPLDPSYPAERLNFMMQDAKAKLLIADENLLPIIKDYNGPVLLTKNIGNLPNSKVPVIPQIHDLFILLYTSGSTGIPKGCMIEHGNLLAFCQDHMKRFNLAENCAVAAYASFGFDANMLDMYPTLLAGAVLHIIPEDMRLELEKLNSYFNDNHITHSFMTTQVGRQFAVDIKDNHSLRYLMVGGETLVPLKPPANYRFFNMYGPTECTIISTVFEVDKFYDNVPIGKPLANMNFYILDKRGERVPVGEEGELYLAGPQVSRGYLNRPDKNEQAYKKNPFSNEPEYARMYYTGDVVRLLADGNIEFIGRQDSQVKVRGFRIELSEIEQVIREFPDISDATVIAKQAPAGGQMVLAYIVAGKKISIDDLHAFIAEQKPPYMVPAATMQIDKIPLNPNMKVDKRKLPEMSFTTQDNNRPCTQLENDLMKIIADIIGVPQIPIDMPIINAGLTSLSAIKLAGQILKNYNCSIDVKALLQGASLISIENIIVNELLQKKTVTDKIKPQQKYCPLTQTQLGIYLECMKENGSDAYNIPLLIRLPQMIDILRLKTAIRQAIDCHPIFYSIITTDAVGDVYMKAQKDFTWAIEDVEISEAVMPPKLTAFSLKEKALFRVRILQTEKALYLMLEVHHIIADGESVMRLLDEINRAYDGYVLEAETYTAFDLAIDEAAARNSDELVVAKAYYDSVFKGVAVDSLPAADIWGKESFLCRSRHAVMIQPDKIKMLCNDYNVTPNVLFTGIFGIILARFMGTDEALFTTIYNGRTDPRTFNMVGMLVKTLPVYAAMSLATSVKEYMQLLRGQLDDSKSNDIYSFAEISRNYNISSDILFAYQGEMLTGIKLGGASVVPEQLDLTKAMAAISVEVFQREDDFEILVEYDGAKYSAGFMESFADAYRMGIMSIFNAQIISDIKLLSPEGLKKLQEMHNTYWPVEERPAYRLLQDSAAKYPERIAAIAAGEVMTYDELNRAANRLGRSLRQTGLGTEKIAGVMLERSSLVYIARQGVLKAGGAFLPIDPQYPDERISFILQDSQAGHLIVSRAVYDNRKEFLNELNINIHFVDEPDRSISDENLDIDVLPQALAYCIYTSGSTGKPKGVMLTQQNLVNFVDNNPKNHEIVGYTKYGKVSLALAAITFDVSIMEEFIPLANGLTICMATEEEIHNPLALEKLCRDNNVDIMTCTPSFLLNIIDIPAMLPIIKQIKSIDLGAESFPAALYEKLRMINSTVYIMNGYGPTETTISCTMAVINSAEHITIGIPNTNVKVVMVDENNEPLPIGALGEMVILGAGVGRGYINREEQTKKSFIRLWEMPAYKSGDLARILVNGEIEFHGRTDNQVKLRGLRVELGEIEAVLNTFPQIKSSIVVMKNNDGEDFLAAYFTAAETIDKKDLTAHLAAALTHYMVPGVLVQLEEFPLTANGKIDKKQLPDVECNIVKRSYEAPQNSVEAKFCDIFAEVLKQDKIGINDDFFALGGTSLSASKVAMAAMNEGYPIVYSDIFQYTTPRRLAMRSLANNNETTAAVIDKEIVDYDYNLLQSILNYNSLEYVNEIKAQSLGNLVLIGATGFLGIHVLKQYLQQENGIVYCLIRKGKRASVEKRLATMLMYYFDDTYEQMMGNRIKCVDGDLTDENSLQQLADLPFTTMINCAASVKHFSHDDSLERINVQGVRNLIALCQQLNKRLIQISTVSVAGEGKNELPPSNKRIAENELYFGQLLDNAYVHTKFMAERYMLEAIKNGLDGKIMRVGNLMSRNSDGEFQINFHTNAFMRRLQGYRALGKFPLGLMDAPAEFSPIDSTAGAILQLSAVKSEFTVFHPYNNHQIFMSDVIASMNRHGFVIEIVDDEKFNECLHIAMQDVKLSKAAAGLIAYMEHDGDTRYEIEAVNKFTIEALYRLNYLWPITSLGYLDKSISMLEQLGFFDN